MQLQLRESADTRNGEPGHNRAMRHWTEERGIAINQAVPQLHPDSWVEAPVAIHAALAPNNLVQVGAFTGIYGGRIGHCSIGRYCSIAPGVDIASDQHPTDWFSTSMVQYVDNVHGWGQWLGANDKKYFSPQQQFMSNSKVVIENDVWIGQGVFIKSGVTIGNGAVVAARSVVTRDVAPYTVVAGVPARPLRLRFDEQLVERMLAAQWWNYNVLSVPGLPFGNPAECLDLLEAAIAAGTPEPLSNERFSLEIRQA